MKNRSTILYGTGFDTPEALFTIRPEAAIGLHIDALNAALSRAEAITDALASALSDLEEGPALDQKALADLVWTLSGMITQAKLIVRHAETGEGEQ